MLCNLHKWHNHFNIMNSEPYARTRLDANICLWIKHPLKLNYKLTTRPILYIRFCVLVEKNIRWKLKPEQFQFTYKIIHFPLLSIFYVLTFSFILILLGYSPFGEHMPMISMCRNVFFHIIHGATISKNNKYSQLCLSQIHRDWRKSLDLEKTWLMWGQNNRK